MQESDIHSGIYQRVARASEIQTRVTNRHNIRPSDAMISQFREILYLRGHNSGTTHPILLIIQLGRDIMTINIVLKFCANRKIFCLS